MERWVLGVGYQVPLLCWRMALLGVCSICLNFLGFAWVTACGAIAIFERNLHIHELSKAAWPEATWRLPFPACVVSHAVCLLIQCHGVSPYLLASSNSPVLAA